MIVHPIEPLFDQNSKLLILGSFPSPKSREMNFFYGHPQNRFWKVMATVLRSPIPVTVEEKKKLMLSNGIALWDVIFSCDIDGAADSSIKNVVPVNLDIIFEKAQIEKIFLTGKTAEKYFNRYLRNIVDLPVICLPSTSPANAAWSLDRLIEEWEKQIKSKQTKDKTM